MTMEMPTRAELEQSFGGKGASVQARNTAADLRAQERAERLLRDAQGLTNCSFTADIDCEFNSGSVGAEYVSDWIEFGHLRVTKEPAIACGSKRQSQAGESALNAEASNYDPEEHFSAPIFAQLLRTQTDETGMIARAKVLLFALGSVPDGFRAKASVIFVGPAVRKG
jgi:hypothetical protein